MNINSWHPLWTRVTCGNLTFLTNHPKETRQDPKQQGKFAKKLFLSCGVSGFRDSKASSQLYSPDLCFELAVLVFVVVAVLMELLGTDCAFLRIRLMHMP